MFRGIPWWQLREHMPEEHRTKLSETRKRLFAEGKLIPTMLGKHFTEQTKLKISLKAKGRIVSSETRKKLSQAQSKRKGEVRSLIARQNISASLIGRLCHENNPNWRGGRYQQCSYCGKEYWVLPSRQYRTGYCSKECQYNDPEYRKRLIMGCNIKPNKPECQLELLLNILSPNEWKFVGDGQLIIGNKCPDFANINGQKKLIELFGDYWHRGEDPQEKIEHYKEYGFDCLVIWQHELENKEAVITKIKMFTREKCS